MRHTRSTHAERLTAQSFSGFGQHSIRNNGTTHDLKVNREYKQTDP